MTDFVAIDVETANAFMGSICQIGAVRFRDGEECDSLDWLVDPRTHFDAINVAIHGIDRSRVAGQPCFTDRHADLCAFTRGAVVVCHTHFDRVSLAQACETARLAPLECRWLDSARVARRTWPDVARGGYGLAALANRLGIRFDHHDAVEDARAAGQIMLHAIAASGLALEDWFRRVNQPIDPLTTDSPRRTGSGEGPLLGHSVVFTGALAMPRRAAADRAHDLGAAVEPGVTKHTTMLVVGDQDLDKLAGHAKSSKHRKAETLIEKGQPIRIVAEMDFLAMVAMDAAET